MKKHLVKGFTGIIFLVAILFNSCNSTRLVSSWSAPDGTLQSYQKVLVIGLMGDKDRELREMIENIIVDKLKQKGINAGSAFMEYGPKEFQQEDESTILNQMKRTGYDGVLTIALLDKSRERSYNPGSVRVVPYTYRFWGYYRTIYTRVYEPGYYTVNTNYILEANFYNLDKDQLFYSAQTKSFDPGSGETLASEFSETLLEDMMKKGIIKP